MNIIGIDENESMASKQALTMLLDRNRAEGGLVQLPFGRCCCCQGIILQHVEARVVYPQSDLIGSRPCPQYRVTWRDLLSCDTCGIVYDPASERFVGMRKWYSE